MFGQANRLVVVISLIFMWALLLNTHHAHATVDGIAATVNGAEIRTKDLEGELNSELQEILASGMPLTEEQIAQFKTATLEKLIKIELLFQKSKKAGVVVDDKLVDEQFQAFKAQFASDEQYKEFLENLGYNEENVKEQFRKNFAVQQFINDTFSSKGEVTDMEIREYYDTNQEKFIQPDSVRARHILLLVKEGDTQDEKDKKRTKLQKIRQEILDGSDFAEMAKRFSEGPSNVKGGDLGYFSRGQMVQPFETVAFGMMPGDVSDIVETKFGYHLIKIEDKKAESTVSFDEAKGQIAGYLKQIKVGTEIERYLENLRKEAEVKIF